MTLFLGTFLTVAFVHLLAVISPGPDFAIVTRNSLIYNRRVGLYTAFGVACGIMVHVAYSLMGIGFLISKSIVLFSLIKFVGAGYLVYIGYKSLRAKPSKETALEISNQLNHSNQLNKENDLEISFKSSFKIGFLTNALNPKASLFFLALFTQIINPLTPKLIQFFYGIEMMVITFVWFSIVSVFFSNKLIRNKVTMVQHYVERATGVVLIALGIKVALSTQK